MGLQINTTRTQIEINTTKPRMDIRQPKGDLTINQTNPKLNIETETPRVIIDQYQCFAEAGLKNYKDLTRQYASLGKQKALQAVGRITQDGNRLADIRNSMPHAVPELAARNAWDGEVGYNVGLIPRSRPQITVTGDININFQRGETNIDYRANKPVINFHRGSVRAYLKQKPSVNVQYVDDRR